MFTEVKRTGAYWNLLNKAINLKTPESIGPLKRNDGSLALTDEEKAIQLKNVDNGQQSIVYTTNTSTGPPPFAELVISERSVQEKVNALKTDKPGTQTLRIFLRKF